MLALTALRFPRYVGAQIFTLDLGCSIRAAALRPWAATSHDMGSALWEDAQKPMVVQPLARMNKDKEEA